MGKLLESRDWWSALHVPWVTLKVENLPCINLIIELLVLRPRNAGQDFLVSVSFISLKITLTSRTSWPTQASLA